MGADSVSNTPGRHGQVPCSHWLATCCLAAVSTGNRKLTSGGKTTAGIMLWHDGPSTVEYLVMRNIAASGFTEAGIATYRELWQQWQPHSMPTAAHMR